MSRVYLLVGTILLVAAVPFARTIVINALAADATIAVASDRAALPCEELAATLHRELWAWFVEDVKAIGPEPWQRPPLPGPLREWESLRRVGAERCHNGKTREQFDHLLALRRALENQSYLLSTTAGADIAALR